MSYLYTNSILQLSIRSALDRLYLSDIPLSGHFIYISNTAHLSWAYFIQLSPSSGYVSHIPFPGSYFRTIRTIKNVTRDQLADFLSIRITNQKVHYLTNNRWMQQDHLSCLYKKLTFQIIYTMGKKCRYMVVLDRCVSNP